jgi:hypothetical protein
MEELKGGPLLFVSLIIIFLFATTKLYTATSNARIQSIYLLVENLLIRSLSNQSFPFIYKEFYKKNVSQKYSIFGGVCEQQKL